MTAASVLGFGIADYRRTVLAYAGIGFLVGLLATIAGILIDGELRALVLAGPAGWEELVAYPIGRVRFFPILASPLLFGFFGYRHARLQGILSTQRAMQAEIQYRASHDSLTNLVNREGLAAALEAELNRAPEGRRHVFAFLDLKRLKSINDAFGHAVGDQALKIVAERIARAVDRIKVVARIGGDEFGVLLGYDGEWSRMEVERDAQRMIQAILQRIDVDSLSVSVGVNIGLYPLERQDNDLCQILRKAGVALHAAGQTPENSFAFFDAELEEATHERNRIEHRLRRALEEQRFQLHYQPIVDVETGELRAFEALARWHEPGQGEVSPEVFVPILEETGLIVAFGKWALAEACRTARDWPSGIRVAVNVSAVQFRTANLPAVVEQILLASGLPASQLELEVTESVLIHDAAHVRTAMLALRALGVRISLDDFGTGYSCLNHLREFPFDRMKIDRSFLTGSRDDEDAAKILRSVIKLGVILGIDTVVEGVESKRDLDLVAAEGATAAQGFFFSPPVPAFELDSLLHKARRLHVA